MQHWRCLRNWRMRDLIISLRQRYGFLISWVRDHINFTGLISNQWPGPSHCTGHHCHRGPLPLHSRTQARPGSRRGRHASPRHRDRRSRPRHTHTGPRGCSTAARCSSAPHISGLETWGRWIEGKLNIEQKSNYKFLLINLQVVESMVQSFPDSKASSRSRSEHSLHGWRWWTEPEVSVCSESSYNYI